VRIFRASYHPNSILGDPSLRPLSNSGQHQTLIRDVMTPLERIRLPQQVVWRCPAARGERDYTSSAAGQPKVVVSRAGALPKPVPKVFFWHFRNTQATPIEVRSLR
jgi:hypothetical protein